MVETITLTCDNCGTEYQKPKSAHEYDLARGRGKNGFHCSKRCSMTYGHKIGKRAKPKPQWGNTFSKKGDFTEYLKNCRQRSKISGKDFNLTEEYLCALWESQDGKCLLTGLDITLQHRTTKKTPTSASLDRIDSSKGYIIGNVQFLAYSVNMAKNDFDDATILQFFTDLTNRATSSS